MTIWLLNFYFYIFYYLFYNKYKHSQEFQRIVCFNLKGLTFSCPSCLAMPPLKMSYSDCAQQSLIIYSRNVILKYALLVTWILFNLSENPTKAQTSVCAYKTKTCVSSTSWPEIKDVHFKWQTPMSPVLLKGKVTLPVRSSITPLFLICSDV